MDTDIKTKIDGILLVDKPSGFTSFDIIRLLKKRLNYSKIGHAGTLDPSATGLLIVLIGKATKLSESIMSSDKEYCGTIKLGESTDSYDAEGSVTETFCCDNITLQNVLSTANEFVGKQLQTAPMFSAKKIAGVPLYKLARKGKEVERKQHSITIHTFDILSFENPYITFSVTCSKGTYIRSIAHDFGKKLCCGAHLTSLRRTKSGSFSVDNAINGQSIKSMQREEILPFILQA